MGVASTRALAVSQRGKVWSRFRGGCALSELGSTGVTSLSSRASSAVSRRTCAAETYVGYGASTHGARFFGFFSFASSLPKAFAMSRGFCLAASSNHLGSNLRDPRK